MDFQLPGVPPTSMPQMSHSPSDESFLGALTSPDHGPPPGFPPPGAFHPGFGPGPGGPHMG